MSQAKRVVLVSRPVGEPKASDFRIEEYALPTPGEGQVLLRTIWLSLDPYMRGRMSDGPSYAAPVPIGGVMEGGTVSEVIASNNPAFAKGDIVLSRAGWQTHALSDGKGLAKIDPKLAPISTAVGVLGMPGMTAYTGPARYRQAAGRRDRRGGGGFRRGRLGGRANREDQGRARGRHRRRQGQMRLRQEGTRLRRLPRSPRSRSGGKAEGSLPEGHRRLFRECRRRGVRGGVSAAQRVRARAGLRPDRALQRHRGDSAEMGLVDDAQRPDQAPDHPRLHRQRFRRAPWRLPARHVATGCARARSSTRNSSPKVSTARRPPSWGC